MKVETLNPPTPGHALTHSSHHHDTSFWSQVISQVAAQANIDPRVAVLVATHESGMNPRALNHTSGAIGLMQLMPATAAELGVNPHDVVQNIVGGVKYLHKQFARFGDTAKALAAYNWGPHHVSRAIARWGDSWLEHAPRGTQHYVNSIMSQVTPSPPAGPDSGAITTAAASLIPAPPALLGSSLDPALLNAARLRILQTVSDAYSLLGSER
jgi:hypothetical protein